MSEHRTGSPNIIEGHREPLQLENAGTVTGPTVPALPAMRKDETVYCSSTRRYRVQITAPQTFIGPDGRKQGGGKMLYAQFDDGVFRNNTKIKADRDLIDEAMQGNKYFGKFGGGSNVHYWLADDQSVKTQAAARQAAMKTLLSMPKAELEAALGQLKAGEAEDHQLPQAPGSEARSKGTRPIPPQ